MAMLAFGDLEKVLIEMGCIAAESGIDLEEITRMQQIYRKAVYKVLGVHSDEVFPAGLDPVSTRDPTSGWWFDD